MENPRTDIEDLLSYIVKMHGRGDRYADILRYLDRKNVDADTRRELLLKLEVLTKPLKDGECGKGKKYRPVSYARIVTGTMFFAFTLYLLHAGILPLPLSIIGLLFAVVVIAETVKLFMNLFK
jgi:hypothetical protein